MYWTYTDTWIITPEVWFTQLRNTIFYSITCLFLNFILQGYIEYLDQLLKILFSLWFTGRRMKGRDRLGVWNRHYTLLYSKIDQFSSVQSPSHVQLLATPWTTARQASLSITNSWSPPKPMSIESVMPFNHLILCHPLHFLLSFFPSITVFSNESVLCIRWPEYWSFSFNISPSNEHPGMICFRMDWLDLLAVQGTLKSHPQYHSSKASILQHSAFFIVQLSHPYMTTGKTIALIGQTFVDKVISLLFNMLCRLVTTFLPRSKCLLT